LEQIALARQSAEQERARKIGGTTEADYTEQEALKTAGLASTDELASEQEIARQRADRVTPLTDSTALSDLEREKTEAQEATAQELGADELAQRQQEYDLIQQELERKKTKASLLK
jgi:hypothetical protein